MVITGSSRGLGYALADEFLRLGDDVVVSSRSEQACKAAAEQLAAKHPARTVLPFACDVRSAGTTALFGMLRTSMHACASCRETLMRHGPARSRHACVPHAAAEADALAEYAQSSLGRVDLWVNNAGASQRAKADLEAADPAELQQIVDTNLMGAMFGARAALKVRWRLPHGLLRWHLQGSPSLLNALPWSVAHWVGRSQGCGRCVGSGAARAGAGGRAQPCLGSGMHGICGWQLGPRRLAPQ